jgi:hypothetical protein
MEFYVTKRVLLLAALSAAISLPAVGADVGVSISVGQPGFYGQIDIGNYPKPVLVNPQPVIVQPGPGVGPGGPIYLHVPPGHARRWSMYCHRYNACGRPVYFVQDRWYNEVYVPRYRERHGDRYRGDRDWRGNEGRERGRDRDWHGNEGPGRGRGREKDHDWH